MEVSLGQCVNTKRKGWICFTYTASDVSCESHGRTRWQIKLCWKRLGYRLYTLLKQRCMQWRCDTDGRRPKCKGPFILWTGDMEKTNRTIPTALQEHMQAKPPSAWHRNRLLRNGCNRQRCLETKSKTGAVTIWRNTASKSGREKAS